LEVREDREMRVLEPGEGQGVYGGEREKRELKELRSPRSLFIIRPP
jgi:hypothetical protein